MAFSFSSISKSSASKFFTSEDNFCIAAILSSTFSLLRFAWAISAETVLRSAFNSSTVTKISRRFASNSLMFSKLSAVTPRVVNLEATPSKSVRIRFISNITMDTQSRVGTSQSRKLLESLDFLGGFLL